MKKGWRTRVFQADNSWARKTSSQAKPYSEGPTEVALCFVLQLLSYFACVCIFGGTCLPESISRAGSLDFLFHVSWLFGVVRQAHGWLEGEDLECIMRFNGENSALTSEKTSKRKHKTQWWYVGRFSCLSLPGLQDAPRELVNVCEHWFLGIFCFDGWAGWVVYARVRLWKGSPMRICNACP